MREAMYGWVTLHLKNEGDGSPIEELEVETVDRELLRCYQEGERPNDYLTLPKLASRFAKEMVKRQVKPIHREHWDADRVAKLGMIRRYVGRYANNLKFTTA